MRPSTTRSARSGETVSRVQPAPARTVPSGAATVSRARTTVVPTAITRPARGVDQPRGVLGDAVALGEGRLAALGRGDAGVEHERRDRDAAGDEAGDELGGERPPGAGHLGAAVLQREHGLVVAQGPGPGHVAVADRLAVRVQVGDDVAPPEVERGDPEPAAGRVPGEEGGATAGRELQDVAAAGAQVGARPVAQLDHPVRRAVGAAWRRGGATREPSRRRAAPPAASPTC